MSGADAEYTADEVRRHASADSCWLVIDGRVLDVTVFLDDHPGLDDVLLAAAGGDATAAFEEASHSHAARSMLADYDIGRLVGGGGGAAEGGGEEAPVAVRVEVDAPPAAREAGSAVAAAPQSGRPPRRRAKVALAPGRSQMHWMRDMGAMPQRRVAAVSLDDVARHCTAGDAWMAVRGRVYDVTRYVEYHPGGRILLDGAGKDATALFDRYHSWVNIDMMLKNCLVGVLR